MHATTGLSELIAIIQPVESTKSESTSYADLPMFEIFIEGCQCCLTLTVYSDCVTGLYTDQHNHDLGAPNTRFTLISPSTWLEIEGMLRMGIDPAKIVSNGSICNV